MIQTSSLDMELRFQQISVGLEAVVNLFQALDRQHVRFCHWKSNLRLENGLCGQTDLDLLVDRKQSQIFRQILSQHGVKPVLAPPGRRYPAVEDYLGFDATSGKLFHLHAHYQLVLGEQFVKNYRLPLEEQFLDSVRFRYGVRIPTPEMEITILALRALLKYRDRDAIKDMLFIRSPGLPAHIRNEIEYLLNQTSVDNISQTLMEIAEVVPSSTVLEFLNTVVETPRAGSTFYRLRGQVRQALRVYQRYDRLQATLKYFQEAWQRRKRLKLSPARKMTLPSGGVTIGLIGADGAGKSTMCQLLAQWLSWKLDVHVYYLGSKQPSHRSRLLYILFRMARRGHRAISGVLGEDNPIAKLVEEFRQLLLYTHHLSIGQDRYRRYLAGRKQAMAGSIVIYDRYPLESVSSDKHYRLLDGPQIQPEDGETGRMACAFARVEQKTYQNIQPPDYFFVLDVSPEVSLQRKPEHGRVAVEAKSQAVGELVTLSGLIPRKLNLVRINADLPFDEVLSELKTRIWEVL